MINELRSSLCSLAVPMFFSQDDYAKHFKLEPEVKQQIIKARYIKKSILFERAETAYLYTLNPFDRFVTRLGYCLLPHRYLYLRFPVGDPLRKEAADELKKLADCIDKGDYNGALESGGFNGNKTLLAEKFRGISCILDKNACCDVDMKDAQRDAILGKTALGVTVVALAGFGAWYVARKNP